MLAHQIKSDDERRSADKEADQSADQCASPSRSPDEHSTDGGRVVLGGAPDRRPASDERMMADNQSNDDATSSSDGKSPPNVGTSDRRQAVRADKLAGRNVEVRLLVRRREAGALIGKRGANIKRLRQIFKDSALFNIPDTGNGPERIVCVNTHSLEELQPILIELTQLFQEKQQQKSGLIRTSTASFSPAQRLYLPGELPSNTMTNPRNSDLVEVKLLVNASHAGLLIGIGGQSIRKLRNDSKAAIKIYEMCCPLSSERVCAIKAKPPVVVSTIKMIFEILAVNPIKGTHKPYDALNFNLNLVDKYGGYTADDECCLASATAAISPPPSSPNSAASHLELLLRNQIDQHQHSFIPQSALALQNQAAHLLAAAAAAVASEQASNAPTTNDHHYEPSRLQAPALRNASRFESNCRSQYDRYTAAATAALAAEKYRSLIRASQQAIVAGRYHPYHSANSRHHGKYESSARVAPNPRQPPSSTSDATRRSAMISSDDCCRSCRSALVDFSCLCCQAASTGGKCESAQSADSAAK